MSKHTQQLAAVLAAIVDQQPLSKEEQKLFEEWGRSDPQVQQQLRQAYFVHHCLRKYQQKWAQSTLPPELQTAMLPSGTQYSRGPLLAVGHWLSRQRIVLVIIAIGLVLGYLGVQRMESIDFFDSNGTVLLREHLIQGLQALQAGQVTLDVTSESVGEFWQWVESQGISRQYQPSIAAPLWGIKLVRVMDRAFPCWIYQYHGQLVMVASFPKHFALEGYVYLDRKMRHVLDQKKRYVEQVGDGAHLVIWQQDSIIYALIASLRRSEIIRLIRN